MFYYFIILFNFASAYNYANTYNYASTILQSKMKTTYLTSEQWSDINYILKNTNNEEMQIKTRNVIYNSYERWAIQQSHVFKQYHTYLCRNIRGDELAIYGLLGLKKATVHYSPTKCGLFTKYADFYLKGELYNGVKKLRPIHSDVISHTPHIVEKTEEPLEIDYSEKWVILRKELNDFEYRCVIYKYSYEFVKEMSNAKIANIMSCSEEHVRKAILSANNILYKIYNGKQVEFICEKDFQ